METNSLTFMTVLKIFASPFPLQMWWNMKHKGNFKQWFNVFLVISEVWQGYELKAWVVSNYHLKLQPKELDRTWDILKSCDLGLSHHALKCYVCWRYWRLFWPLTPSTFFNIHSIWWFWWKFSFFRLKIGWILSYEQKCVCLFFWHLRHT